MKNCLDLQVLELFGIPFTPLPLGEFARTIVAELSRGRRGLVVFTPDARALSLAILRRDIRELYRRVDFVACDGFGGTMAARALGKELPRVPGVDLAWELCRLGEKEALGFFFLGARPEVIAAAVRRVRESFPRLIVRGFHHGYFPGEGPVDTIRKARPDVLLVGLGFPRQERWILSHRDLFGVAVGVGSAFDIWSGRFPRAPRWIQEAGLEWLYRALQDPRRIKRLWAVPFLLGCIGLEWLKTQALGRRGPRWRSAGPGPHPLGRPRPPIKDGVRHVDGGISAHDHTDHHHQGESPEHRPPEG